MQYHHPIDSGPRSKCDQVVFEAIAKACEIIVTSRCPPSLDSTSSSNRAGTSSHATSRFNLQLSELPGVRSILQTIKSGGGALHVPLRLDVYYPHDEHRRELLERWCLEYSVCGMERFLTREGIVTQDPIAQLRLVCKRIVNWLRTLCCSTCLLPAQAFQREQAPALGFSLYMISDAGDDVSDLVHKQGFQVQSQPCSVVTPYGELAWSVYYAPKRDIDRLVPRKLSSTSVSFRQVSAAIPIQTNNSSNHRMNHVSSSQDLQRHANEPSEQTEKMVPQSAPEYGGLAHYPPSRFGTTFDPSHINNRFRGDRQEESLKTSNQPRTLLQRRHTVLGPQTTMTPPRSQSPVPSQTFNGIQPPERVLSGLSLMMMMNDGGKEQNEKRRAALHQMPPHLIEQAHQAHAHVAPSTTRQGEYGYAYNNHIPWQAIHPSQTKPTTFDRSPSDVSEAGTHPISASPHRHSPWLSAALASTPPGEAFLGGTTSPPFLLPPRNLMSTPPFTPRPVTFVHPQHGVEPIPATPDPKAPTNTTVTAKTDTAYEETYDYHKVVPPLASLDLLQSSPFQTSHAQGSMLLASLSLGAAGSNLPPTDFRASSNSMPLFTTLTPSAADEYLVEDMPFVVDAVTTSSKPFASSSTTHPSSANTTAARDLSESASVASFAQQLKSGNRLRLFDSTAQLKPDELVDSLANQLAEFRTFEASLTQPTPSKHGDGPNNRGDPSSAPIATRS